MQIYAMWKINLVVEASSDYNSGEFCPMVKIVEMEMIEGTMMDEKMASP